jgi:hypothetical protein
MEPGADAHFDEGFGCLDRRDYRGAEACFRAALAQEPEFLEAQVNLAWTLEQLGDLAQAEHAYQRALELDPTCLEALRNLGVLLVGQKRFAEGQTLYDRLLSLHPEVPAVWSNLGALKVGLGQEEEAEACFRRALALDPRYARASFNLSYLLLRRGQYEEGWRVHKAGERAATAFNFPFPEWQGEDLAGQAILIGPEGGHGDMIQFCRYAPLLKARGAARVGILCHPALTRLFASLDGVDEVLGLEAGLPGDGWDCWTLPLSLPLHFGTRLDTIPAALPYLRAEPERVEAWRPRLPKAGLRVGLAWKGDPRFETDGDRSLTSLADLAPLWAVSGVAFVSLQKGQGEHEAAAPPAGQPLIPLGSQVEDFADTAAIMAGLDLIITVDSAAAHLAGALGKPCWVLLPAYRTDWRWLTGRADAVWYPGVLRLFRQDEDGDWSGVVRAVAAALEGRGQGLF